MRWDSGEGWLGEGLRHNAIVAALNPEDPSSPTPMRLYYKTAEYETAARNAYDKFLSPVNEAINKLKSFDPSWDSPLSLPSPHCDSRIPDVDTGRSSPDLLFVRLVLLAKWINFTVTSLQFEITLNSNQFDGSKFWWTDFTKWNEVAYTMMSCHDVCFNACGTRTIRVCMNPLLVLSQAKTWEPSSELMQFDGSSRIVWFFTLLSSGTTLPLVLASPTSPSPPDIHADAPESWKSNICRAIQILQIWV
jgi:hypothetical protein